MPNGKEDVIKKLREAWPDLPPEALVWLSEHPENIQWPETEDEFWEWVRVIYTPEEVAFLESGSESANEQLATVREYWQGIQPSEPETPSQAALKTFWEWAGTKYSPREIEEIRKNPTTYFQFYKSKIQGTQWDVDIEKLPLGRPQPEKFGINEVDWKTLQMLSGNPARVQAELEKWISTGYIDQFQARDIWDEAGLRARQAGATVLSTGYTEEEWPEQYAKQQAAREAGRKKPGAFLEGITMETLGRSPLAKRKPGVKALSPWDRLVAEARPERIARL